MRQVTCRVVGADPELAVTDGELPAVGPSDVHVRVTAAGVSFVDALLVRGEYQIKVPPPFTPGSEVAGVVAAVGADVTAVEVGQRVLALTGFGGFATDVVANVASVLALPERIDDATASVFATSYCTARFALLDRGRLSPGERVLVLGAGGGVGQAAVDVAAMLGAEVIAAASTPEKRAAAHERGAHHVLDSTGDVVAEVRALVGGVDVVVDPIGGEATMAGLRCLHPEGRLLVVGFAGGSIATLPANRVLLQNRAAVGVDWGAWVAAYPHTFAPTCADLLGAVAEGRLHPGPAATRPLDDAATCLRDVIGRRVVGRVALLP